MNVGWDLGAGGTREGCFFPFLWGGEHTGNWVVCIEQQTARLVANK